MIHCFKAKGVVSNTTVKRIFKFSRAADVISTVNKPPFSSHFCKVKFFEKFLGVFNKKAAGAECLAHAFSGQHIVDFTTPITNISYSKYNLHTSYIKER